MGANKSKGRVAWCVLRGWGQRVVKNSQTAGLGGSLAGSDGSDESNKVDRKRRALVVESSPCQSSQPSPF